MTYVLWILQLLLAVSFVLGGIARLFLPVGVLAGTMSWVGSVPEPLLRFIGLAEILGGLGLLLPSATRLLPWLTPLAALGLAVIALLATLFHLVRGEAGLILSALLPGLMAAGVAYGRWRLAPISPRSADSRST
jgi:uncharacterized membrane protein YphA (DoxX/SURF4 family)